MADSVANSLENLGITIERIAGSDRFETSVQIANKLGTVKEAFIVTGETFPYALSGSALAAKNSSPIILVNSTPSTSTKELLNKYSDKISTRYILGGLGVVSSGTLSDIGTIDPTPQAASGTFVTPSTLKFQDVFAKWMDSYSDGYFTGHTFPSIEAKQFTIKIYDQNMKPVGMSTKYEYAGHRNKRCKFYERSC